MQFEDFVINQIEAHPSMEPQDAVKLCFQAAFGAEHLLKDAHAAKVYLEREYAALEQYSEVMPSEKVLSEADKTETGRAEEGVTEEPLYEQISGNVCRINLRSWKQKRLPLEWLFRMFGYSVRSAEIKQQEVAKEVQEAVSPKTADNHERFSSYIKKIGQLTAQNKMPFLEEVWNTYLDSYYKSGVHAVHHSENYRSQERPAYRIVSSEFLPVFPILESIAADREKREMTASYVIALEGRAASGKSTMAEKLRNLLEAEVIAMDDFFLPFEMRSKERMEEPGGNIHYERFLKEVLPYIGKPEDFAFRRFDCGQGNYQGEVHIKPSRFRIVEGSYSTHPKFGAYADLKVFMDVDSETQMLRILARNGEEMAKNFREKWIPLEEVYFAHYEIASKADIQLAVL